jgi:hypothetical protein
MASVAALPVAQASGDERFFLYSAIAMALTVVAGFSLQLGMGRSSFSAPLLVHAHAVVFMGWVAIYLLQNIFVATGRMRLHRTLGWIATGWLLAMLVLGVAVTVAMVRRGHAPFFFQPQHFLIFNPLSLFAAAGLTVAAVVLRRRTEWHRRLHFCGMAILVGPAFGRLLPMPLMQPWAWEATFAATMIFPLLGVWADLRRSKRVHPAWKWGIGTMLGALLIIEAISYSPVGSAIYRATTEGSPGAAVAPLEFALPPAGLQVTGRT